jgi:DNA-binding transcriptional MerR regulator
MTPEATVIPDKIYFKIGEVCELVGVQAHVLRYWETEFSVLSPQKNKSGQRSYRRRDVEIALRIKQLLYNEMFTIAGARKKIQTEQRDGRATSKTTIRAEIDPKAPTLFDAEIEANVIAESGADDVGRGAYTVQQRDALRTVASHLLELREMLKTSPR